MMRRLALAVLTVMLVAAAAHAAEIDRTAVDFKTPADIKWVRNAAGNVCESD